jgi:shikimate kinase
VSGPDEPEDLTEPEARAVVSDLRLDRPIALVGLMGAGKTTVGRRLATWLNLPFVDADDEIERAAGLSIPEIFAKHGEAEFRRGERRVIARLLDSGPIVLATGGGAFIDPETRALMRQKAISVWLRADLDVLLKRVERRDNRPLLKQGEPRDIMQSLMAKRYPIYAEADVIIDSSTGPHAVSVKAVADALLQRQNSIAAAAKA